ncbi:MAG: MAPEG family protein [Xanthomonadales bacterium]|nr:MAPEG family protein [Xanthomonadales bacterium]
MEPRLVFWPAVAMALLTFLVWLRMYASRVGEMRRLRIHPQAVATSAMAAAGFQDTRAADNFRNLFELPVLFYAALGIAFAIGAVDALLLALAWLFVALRVAHSSIHLGYNRVMHRFIAYAAGGFVLWALWALLAWRLLA